jgi:hypothetical protein
MKRAVVAAFAVPKALPLVVGAQQAGKVYKVGLLANLPPPPDPVSTVFLDAFRDGLKDAGFVEGKNQAHVYRPSRTLE